MTRSARRDRGSRPSSVTGDLVDVAVPVRYLAHVARLIEELDRMPRHPAALPMSPVPVTEIEPAWPTAELRRFAQGRTRSHVTIAAVLDVLADRPGMMLLVTELAEAIRQPAKIIIGALAGLTRLVKSHHDYDRFGLPLIRTRRHVIGGQEEYRLGLSPLQARRWKQVRRGKVALDPASGV